MNISRKPPPVNNEGIIKINLTKTRELMRSISEVTNDDYFEDGNDRNNNNNINNNNTNVFFDLRQEYENAVHCLKSAESMMKSLQHHLLTKVEQIVTKDKQLAEKDAQLVAKDAQLAKRDAQLASKDECIECLERRMVQMSMELASTNMMKDELEYKLLKTSVVRSESDSEEGGNKVSVGSSSDRDDNGDDDAVVATSDAMAARLAKYRPRSTCNNGKKRSSQIQEDDNNNINHRSSENGNNNNNNNNNNSNSSSSCLGLQKPKPSLLVPFGHQRKSYLMDEKEKRTVRFSPMEGMRFYERPSEIDASRLFYGDDDYDTMKMERNEAVREYNTLKHVSLTSCGNNNGGDEGDTGDKKAQQRRRCTLTGIENVITRDVQEDIWKRREECIRAVLEEEARQVKLLGGCGGRGRGMQQKQQQQQQRERDVERIANVSRLHSKHAVEMARRCANRQVVARSESVERC